MSCTTYIHVYTRQDFAERACEIADLCEGEGADRHNELPPGVWFFYGDDNYTHSLDRLDREGIPYLAVVECSSPDDGPPGAEVRLSHGGKRLVVDGDDPKYPVIAWGQDGPDPGAVERMKAWHTALAEFYAWCAEAVSAPEDSPYHEEEPAE